jgi:hypothetical protein
MSSTAGAGGAAFDAEADTADDAGPGRPPTDAERAYLVARVADLEAAVVKVENQIKGSQSTLKTLKAELAEARRAQKAGAE